ncbi:Dihydroorotase [compost metagenome]
MSTQNTTQLTITRPDDWHLHLRDGAALEAVVADTARQFARAIIMPNLKPPVTTTEQALAYRGRILEALAKAGGNPAAFTPLMTLYLTDNTSAEEIFRAHESGQVYAVKLYPAGATTNSDAGVTDLRASARRRSKRWKNAACRCWCMVKSRIRLSTCSIAKRCSSIAS